MSDLEPVDYMANRLAHGVYPGGVKYMFSEEDWLAFKGELRAMSAKADVRTASRARLVQDRATKAELVQLMGDWNDKNAGKPMGEADSLIRLLFDWAQPND